MREEDPAADAGEELSTDTSELDDLQFILQETRVLLLQQILAHRTGTLSVEELDYRNTDFSEKNIRYHLRKLEQREIVETLEIPKGERMRHLPNTFFAVTEKGVRLLKQANLFKEIEAWQQVYDQMERTKRIKEIEALETRPTSQRTLNSTSEEVKATSERV